MSLLRTLNQLHRAIRKEAKRNPAFAARLEAVFAAHAQRFKTAPAETLEEFFLHAPEAPANDVAEAAALDFNPISLFAREGELGLRGAVAGAEAGSIRALMIEHNLDPSGAALEKSGEALLDYLVAQARRRVERDKKLFAY